MSKFELVSPFQPAGDQPQAIERLAEGFLQGQLNQTLMGVTGSGKTFTMANVIARYGRPTLVMSHNKTLAASYTRNLKSFFPGMRCGICQLLRLLSARGLHPPARHLHRERRRGQRRDRAASPGMYECAGQPGRRSGGGERLMHLRFGFSGRLPEDDGTTAGGRLD